MRRIVIIEDEKAASRNLTAMLSTVMPDAEVVAVIDSVVDSVEWFAENPAPEVVFMDIHLADGSAFEIFDRVKVECPIVFTTAYDEYAIRAFKVNSIDYILKPIGEEDLRRAVEKLSNLTHNDNAQQSHIDLIMKMLGRGQRYTSHLLIPRHGDKLTPIAVSSIDYFFIEDGVVKAVIDRDVSYTIPYTLDQLTDMVDPSLFFRVNRQYLLTRDSIADIDLWFGSRLSINLKRGAHDKIIVSKPRVAEFKQWFTGTTLL